MIKHSARQFPDILGFCLFCHELLVPFLVVLELLQVVVEFHLADTPLHELSHVLRRQLVLSAHAVIHSIHKDGWRKLLAVIVAKHPFVGILHDAQPLQHTEVVSHPLFITTGFAPLLDSFEHFVEIFLLDAVICQMFPQMTAVELSDGIAQRVGIGCHLIGVSRPLTGADHCSDTEGCQENESGSHGCGFHSVTA